MKANWTNLDLLVITMLVVFMSLVAKLKDEDRTKFPWLVSGNRTQLGAEYNTIAKSIRSGEGFSHPFNVKSGATAWTPPVLPYILASLYALTDDNESFVAEIVVLLQGLVLVFSGLLVVKLAKELGIRWWGHVVFFVMLCESYTELFQTTGDYWLNLLGLNLVYYFCTYKWDTITQTPRTVCAWGVSGGLFALCTPSLGFCWATITAILFVRMQRRLSANCKKPLKLLILAGICSIIVITPWMLRNRIALGVWVPINSNVVYKAWQSQILDNDGVIDSKTNWDHPWGNDYEQRAEYIRVGEVEFLYSRWLSVTHSLINKPSEFCFRAADRIFAALFYYEPFSKDIEKFQWLMSFKRAVFPLPLVATFLIFVFGSMPLPRPIVIAMLVVATYLGPSILISYDERNAVPLLTAKSCLIVGGIWALQRIISLKSKPDKFST